MAVGTIGRGFALTPKVIAGEGERKRIKRAFAMVKARKRKR